MQAVEPQAIQVNGATLSYLELGAGDPAIFVHGSLGDFRTWLEVVAPVATRYRVIAVSRRGHYPNAAPGDYTQSLPEVHAADLAALLDALNLGPAHLFGHSYGGVVSLVLATRRPELVRTLTLAEPPLFEWLNDSEEGRALYATLQQQTLAPARAASQAGEMEGAARMFLDGVIGPGTFDQVPPVVRAAVMDNAAAMRAELETPLADFFSTVSRQDVQRLKMPLLLLQGEHTPRIFRKVLDELARCRPDAHRVTIPGVSHDLYNPPEVVQALRAFMGQH